MNIIFFGNTKYSTIGAKIVNTTYPLSLIITKKLAVNPVKQMAEELRIPLVETSKLDSKVIEKIAKLQPDFFVIEDFGLILPNELSKLPKIAPLNIHHSLLPKYRGSSPAPFAILNGDVKSGVSIIRIIDTVDAGDILTQKEYTLIPNETTDSLLTKLNELGGHLLVEVIGQYLKGEEKPIPQDNSQATYTKHFVKESGYFDINNPPSPEVLDRMIRAYYPWPGVWTRWNGKIVKFIPTPVILNKRSAVKDLSRMRAPNKSGDSSPPKADQNDSREFLIQMEGKKAIPAKDFLNGYPDFPIYPAKRG